MLNFVRSNNKVSLAQVLLSTAWLGQHVGGVGKDGGPTNLPLNNALHSPHGVHPPVRQDSLGEGTQT